MPLDIARIRALCFDLDGTLSDTDDEYTGSVSKWLRRAHLFRDPDRAARRFVMWSESPANALLGLADTVGLDAPLIRLIDHRDRHRRQQGRPFLVVPGVPEMLERLHGRYAMAIVSARDEDSTQQFLQESGLSGYFGVVISALSARHTKPYPDPILLAAQKMGVAPGECLITGDTTVDIRAGRAAGSQTVGVLCGFGEQAELVRSGADLILGSTADLADTLQAGK
jgi:N-acetyl-D-muramate 6-phosphate phosphatase